MAFRARYVAEAVVKPRSVLGHGLSFPTPMLRRQHCWPTTDDDAVKLAAYISEPVEAMKLWPSGVKVTWYSETREAAQPHKEEWQSFGWEVVSVEVRSF